MAPDPALALEATFEYPGADELNSRYKINITKGNGYMAPVDCNTPTTGDIGLVKVRSTEPVGAAKDGLVCFKLTTNTGWLEVQIPDVFEIRGDGLKSGTGHNMSADLTTEAGVHTTVTLNPSGSTPVGTGRNQNDPPTKLLLLRATG